MEKRKYSKIFRITETAFIKALHKEAKEVYGYYEGTFSGTLPILNTIKHSKLRVVMIRLFN